MMNAVIDKRAVLAAFSDQAQPVDGVCRVELVERPFQGYYNLRCEPSEEAIGQIVSQVLGVALPVEPNRVVAADQVTIYWLGPDEWMLRTPSEEDRTLVEELSSRLDGQWFALTDLGGGMTHLVVSGDAAADVMSQGTTFDLHPRVFGPGQCAQTLMAKTNVLLAPTVSAPPAFDLFVRRSFADHLLNFLRDASHDVGFRFTRQT